MAPNAIAPAVSATRASDDEILGLAPNAVRKTNRMVATKLPGDLNRMDAFFYSRRPEDHAELARAVARLDPQSFASLARAMTELANAPAAKTNAAKILLQIRSRHFIRAHGKLTSQKWIRLALPQQARSRGSMPPRPIFSRPRIQPRCTV